MVFILQQFTQCLFVLKDLNKENLLAHSRTVSVDVSVDNTFGEFGLRRLLQVGVIHLKGQVQVDHGRGLLV